jgi:hypothetical protein
MKAIYYASYLAVICELVYSIIAANGLAWVCVGALAVMFLTYGPPSYFLRRVDRTGEARDE